MADEQQQPQQEGNPPPQPMDPLEVRDTLLLAINKCAEDVLMGAMDENGAAELANAGLRLAQTYLLIDPTVDQQGIPVAGQAMVGAIADTVKPQPSPDGQAHGQVTRKPGEAPKVGPGASAQGIEQAHERAQKILSSDRGSRPIPRPRAGA